MLRLVGLAVLVGAVGCDRLWNIDHIDPCTHCDDGGADGPGDGSNELPDDAGIDADPNADTDGDGIVDGMDNCRTIVNPNQRDHDGDQKGDVCDPCPHLASSLVPNPDTDTDGDGLGNGCDPRPAMPGDTATLFAGFYSASEIVGWNQSPPGAWAVTGSALKLGADNITNATIELPASRNDIFVQLSVRGASLGAGSVRFFTISAGRNGSMQHDCVLSVPAAGPKELRYVEFTGTQAVPWNGQLTLTNPMLLSIRGTHAVCAVGGAAPEVIDLNPASSSTGTHTGVLGFVATQAAVDIDYVFIATPG